MEFGFHIIILVMSVVIHEVSHGYAASFLGDQTARYQGRLTLNPLKHLDPIGSVLIPALSYFTAGLLFGWAKPVPYNPYNLRPGRWSEAIVAGAGPLSNLSIALIFSFLLRSGVSSGWASEAFLEITAIVVLVNIVLAVFNLIPIPPLDGSKLLFALFPEKLFVLRNFYEKYGFVLLLFVIFFLWQYLLPVVSLLFSVFTGVRF
jgi:Zn-dependent protease